MNSRKNIQKKSICDLTSIEINEWRWLLEASANSARAFLSPEFCFAVDKAQGGVSVILVRENSNLIAVFPLQIAKGISGFLGAYTQVGGDVSDYFEIVGNKSNKVDFLEIFKKIRITSFYYTHASKGIENNSLPIFLENFTYRISAENEKNIFETAQEINKKFWNDAARCQRRVEKDIGSIEFKWHEHDKKILYMLISMKINQYVSTGKNKAPLFRKDVQSILESLMCNGSKTCRGTLSTLRVGGKIIAIHFGIQTKKHMHYWFPAYDKEYAKYSPGKILLYFILMHSESNGIQSIDFGEGAAEYKNATSNEIENLGKGLVEIGFAGEVSTLPRKLAWRLQKNAYLA